MFLKFTQYLKSVKAPLHIYSNVESLIKKVNGCENNPKQVIHNKSS